MRKEFLVEKQGKVFVLYAGLISEAHEKGLVSIITDLIQLPNEETKHTAVVKATVTMLQDGQEKVYTGYGDADRTNVAPAMQKCLLRMAETRAKSRALRDAINVGETAFEELGDDEGETQPAAPYRQETQGNGVHSPGQSAQAILAGSLRGQVNTWGVQCPKCNCPPDKRHVGDCTEEDIPTQTRIQQAKRTVEALSR
jgi:hypothetical protein